MKENVEIDFTLKNNVEDQKVIQKKLDAHNIHVKELERQSGLHQNVLKKRDVLEKANNTLQKVIQRFEGELLEELEHATTQNLYYLLDHAGREMTKEAKVMDDYSLEVLTLWTAVSSKHFTRAAPSAFT